MLASPLESLYATPDETSMFAFLQLQGRFRRMNQIWVERGRPEGTDQEDWFETERQLNRRGVPRPAGR